MRRERVVGGIIGRMGRMRRRWKCWAIGGRISSTRCKGVSLCIMSPGSLGTICARDRNHRSYMSHCFYFDHGHRLTPSPQMCQILRKKLHGEIWIIQMMREELGIGAFISYFPSQSRRPMIQSPGLPWSKSKLEQWSAPGLDP